MIRERDMEHYYGQMVKNIVGFGRKDFNMGMDKLLKQMVLLSEESGSKENSFLLNSLLILLLK